MIITNPRKNSSSPDNRFRQPGRRSRRAAAPFRTSYQLLPFLEVMERRTLLATITVTNTGDSGPGTLRQAILDANDSIRPSTIDFGIPGQGVHTIAPSSPLPNIGATVLIDGTSQPGYAGTPIIELEGWNAGPANGLTIVGSGTIVRGLDIGGFFSGAGIEITGPAATGNRALGNYIGIDPSGRFARPNGTGIQVASGAHDNTVGGTDPGQGNLIAYSTGSGAVVDGNDSLGNQFSANRIFSTGHDLRFDGSGNYVQLPSFPVGGSLTFEAWVESDDVHAGWSRIFDFSDGPGNHELDLDWYWTTGTMSMGVQDQDNNWTGLGTSAVFPQGQWVHVAVTIDDQGNSVIYWNGVQEAAATVAVPQVLSRTQMYLGLSPWSSDAP